jgi:hypothetical protein
MCGTDRVGIPQRVDRPKRRRQRDRRHRRGRTATGCISTRGRRTAPRRHRRESRDQVSPRKILWSLSVSDTRDQNVCSICFTFDGGLHLLTHSSTTTIQHHQERCSDRDFFFPPTRTNMLSRYPRFTDGAHVCTFDSPHVCTFGSSDHQRLSPSRWKCRVRRHMLCRKLRIWYLGA